MKYSEFVFLLHAKKVCAVGTTFRTWSLKLPKNSRGSPFDGEKALSSSQYAVIMQHGHFIPIKYELCLMSKLRVDSRYKAQLCVAPLDISTKRPVSAVFLGFCQ
jgi:hypothetical protein